MTQYLRIIAFSFIAVFVFSCSSSKKTTVNKVQAKETFKTYTILSEDLRFFNPVDSIYLAGTLTTPQGLSDFPVVVLLSGSGAQNRDSEIFGHSPFATIANYLSSQGIGVLRYDDRGVAESEGKFTDATSKDFAKDALSAVRFLRAKKKMKKVGLVGHSEGGMIAQIAAVNNPSISFIVSLAGPGTHIKNLMLLQNKIALSGMGFSEKEIEGYLGFSKEAYDIIDITTPKEQLYDPLMKLTHNYYASLPDSTQVKIAPSKESFYFQLAYAFFSPWYRYFINYDPADNLSKITCPVLALNGALDVQVTADENLAAIEKHLKNGACADMKIMKLDSLNHLFQKAVTGNTDEYKTIEESFNKRPLKIMRDWIFRLRD